MSGVINQAYSSAFVQSAPFTDWTSAIALFQLYRCRSIRLTLIPLQTNTAILSGGFLVVCDWANDGYTLVATVNDSLVATRRKIVDVLTNQPIVMTLPNLSGNPDWTKTSSSLSSNQTFGFSLQASGLTASQAYFKAVIEIEVEFREGC